jgi:hypothetical protein
MNQSVHPVKVHSTGGNFVWDSEQETPNYQVATLEYADGRIMDVELTNLYAPPAPAFNVFYTTEGYLSAGDEWKAVRGSFTPRGGDVAPTGVSERATNASFPRTTYTPAKIDPAGEPAVSHFENFIACVRSRKVEDLYCDILQGHLSTTLCHLANISFRTGRKLIFDPATERFGKDEEANRYLTREYRKPYVLPDKV